MHFMYSLTDIVVNIIGLAKKLNLATKVIPTLFSQKTSSSKFSKTKAFFMVPLLYSVTSPSVFKNFVISLEYLPLESPLVENSHGAIKSRVLNSVHEISEEMPLKLESALAVDADCPERPWAHVMSSARLRCSGGISGNGRLENFLCRRNPDLQMFGFEFEVEAELVGTSDKIFASSLADDELCVWSFDFRLMS